MMNLRIEFSYRTPNRLLSCLLDDHAPLLPLSSLAPAPVTCPSFQASTCSPHLFHMSPCFLCTPHLGVPNLYVLVLKCYIHSVQTVMCVSYRIQYMVVARLEYVVKSQISDGRDWGWDTGVRIACLVCTRAKFRRWILQLVPLFA